MLNFSNGVTPVFVVGTGRSGTHWLGYTLASHSDVTATIEVKPVFSWVTKMALNHTQESVFFSKLCRQYRKYLIRTKTPIYMDKSHPNIWLVEKLKAVFPDAKFIGIERNPYATVSSMLKHKKVASWHSRWKEFPIPNRFLGISESCAERYDGMSLVEKAALRWNAHHERLLELEKKFERSFMYISYEDMAQSQSDTLLRLEKFLELNTPIDAPEIKTESLDKWKKYLTDNDVASIHAVTGIPPENA
jgi:hypothetical protein